MCDKILNKFLENSRDMSNKNQEIFDQRFM